MDSQDRKIARNTPREPGVRAAETTLRILEAVAFARDPLGVTQIAKQLKLSKAGVFRYLQSLIEHGFVVQNRDTLRYRLGPKAYAVSHLAPVGSDLIDASDEPIRELSRQTGLSVVLGAPMEDSVIIMRTFAGTRGMGLTVTPGRVIKPLHAPVHGKLVLAFGPEELKEKVLSAPLSPETPKTITDPSQLRQELDKIRRVGFSMALEENRLGVAALAAPIFGPNNELVGSIALVSFAHDITANPDPSLSEAAVDAAAKITKHLRSAAGL